MTRIELHRIIEQILAQTNLSILTTEHGNKPEGKKKPQTWELEQTFFNKSAVKEERWK